MSTATSAFWRPAAKIFEIGFQQLGHVHFGSIMDMARIAPDLARLRGDRSVYQTVSRYVKDERLRMMLSFHPLLIGGNPFRASSIYCLISYLERHWGIHFAMGGTGALANGLVDLCAARATRSATRPRSKRSRWRTGGRPGCG